MGIDSSETTGTDTISITTSIGETFYVVVYGYSGHGSFNLEVNYPETSETPSETSTTTTNGFSGFTAILSTIGVLSISLFVLIRQKKK